METPAEDYLIHSHRPAAPRILRTGRPGACCRPLHRGRACGREWQLSVHDAPHRCNGPQFRGGDVCGPLVGLHASEELYAPEFTPFSLLLEEWDAIDSPYRDWSSAVSEGRASL